MKLKPADILFTTKYKEGTTMTDVIVDLCDNEGYNTIYDDGDEVVMRDGDNKIVFVNIQADNRVYATHYK